MNHSAYYSAIAFIVILFGTAVFMAMMSKRGKAKKTAKPEPERESMHRFVAMCDDGKWREADGSIAHGTYTAAGGNVLSVVDGAMRMRMGECFGDHFNYEINFIGASVEGSVEALIGLKKGVVTMQGASIEPPTIGVAHGYVLSKDASARRQKVVDELARRTGLWSERKAKYKLEAARKMMIIRGLKAHTEQALFAGICDRYNTMPADEVLALASGNK